MKSSSNSLNSIGGVTDRGTYLAANKWFVEMMRRRLDCDGSDMSSQAVISVRQRPVLLLDVCRNAAVPVGSFEIAAVFIAQALATGAVPLTLESIGEEEYERQARQQGAVVALLPTLWKIVRDSAGGQDLLAPLEPKSALRMKRWPDFRVVANRADDFRICSLLLKRACTVSECMSLLELERESVQRFFNAAYLTGYALVEERDSAVSDVEVARSGVSVIAGLWRGIRGKLIRRVA